MRRLMGFRKSEDEANVTKMMSVPTSEKQEAIRSMVSRAGMGLSFAWLAMSDLLPRNAYAARRARADKKLEHENIE